jgi:hypothetical protein
MLKEDDPAERRNCAAWVEARPKCVAGKNVLAPARIREWRDPSAGRVCHRKRLLSTRKMGDPGQCVDGERNSLLEELRGTGVRRGKKGIEKCVLGYIMQAHSRVCRLRKNLELQ